MSSDHVRNEGSHDLYERADVVHQDLMRSDRKGNGTRGYRYGNVGRSCPSRRGETKMNRSVMFASLVAVLVLASCGRVSAQETINDVVGFLVTNQAVPTGAFEKDLAAANAARDAIAKSLLLDLTSMPLATASSGFLYRLNPELGTVERATESFGGFFVERALTPGNGHASFGVSTSTASFDRFDGHSLRDGALVTIANQFRDEAAPYNTESLILHLRSSVMTLFGSVGVGSRVEIGAAVPVVQLTLDGQRINNYRGKTLIQASGNATASGLADVALRGKVNLLALRTGGVAIAGEVRLPTGDATNLL